jgi:membrane protease YdiL (CAAX protease family)
LPAFQSTQPPRLNRTLQFALFGTSTLWVFAAHALAGSAARGIWVRFNLPAEAMLLQSILWLFLLILGFAILQTISGRPLPLRDVIGLPQRATAREEWTIGAAIGWGTMVLAVLPMAIFGSLRVHFFTDLRSFLLVITNLLTLLIAALAEEVAFRGYPFRSLIRAIGPVTATILMAILFGLVHILNPNATGIGLLIAMLAGVILSIAWLRTHGLWLGWGFHFAWNASMGILFGLPVSGLTDFSSVIQTDAYGRRWLTGGDYGPEAAFFTIFACLASLIVLVFLTREYAWNYTHPPIVAGGYALDVAPPPAHAAMEQEAQSRPGSLVQILPTTPSTMSVEPLQQPVAADTEAPPSPS